MADSPPGRQHTADRGQPLPQPDGLASWRPRRPRGPGKPQGPGNEPAAPPARRRRRRIAGLGCVVAVAALLAASCGSGGSSSGTSGTLKIITWVNPPAVQAFKTIDSEFQKKYPHIKVQLQTAANVTGPYLTLQQTSVDSSSADIVTNVQPVQALPLKPTRSNMTTWQFWSTHKVFAPLNGQSFLGNYTGDALTSETYNGKVYGIMAGAYQEGIFYNKAIFARYHLSPPATWNQFLTVLSTLKSHGVTPMYLGLGGVGPVYLQYLYYELMISDWYPHAPGGNLARDLENGSAKWTSPYFTQAMNQEKQLAQYLEPNYTGVPWEGMPGAFAKGQAAMMPDGSWDMTLVHQANPSAQVGFFPLPGSNNAADNQPEVGDNLSISVLGNAPDKAAAMKWLQFFSQPGIYQQYADITGVSPVQHGTYTSPAARALGSWLNKGVNLNAFYPPLSPQAPYWDQLANWPTLQLDVVQGSKTPAQAESLYQSDWKP
jgi:raffinose/stachyose/melibiose transport system substrate-binding protein